MNGIKRESVERITVEEAAKITGLGVQYIRIKMQRGELPFGWVEKGSHGRYTYYVFRRKVLNFLNSQ